MKKILALVLSLAMVVALASCGGGSSKPAASSGAANSAPAASGDKSEAPAASGNSAEEITLWTYPIGNWGKEDVVKELTDAFTAETGIKVSVEYLDYTNGDDKVNSAITAKNAPDVIMEGPERLVANWGANGYMVDLSDLMDDTDKTEIYENVLSACTNSEGAVYEYPLVMTAHCMAVNLTAFKEAGADQYLDLDTHTWTTENFIKAVDALYAKYGDTVAARLLRRSGWRSGHPRSGQ